MKIYTIIDKATGRELYAKFDNEVSENEVVVEVLRTEPMENPHFDFETQTYYEGEPTDLELPETTEI
jgi:hypothetical protein